MDTKNIKCEECGKTQAHPFCCERPMEFEKALWTCKKCKKNKKIKCCDEPMVPETDEDIDMPDEAVEEFESMFDEEKNKHDEDKKRSYIG